MTSPGVRRLYFDDGKGDLHVFDGKDAFWRWYGAPNQYRDPLQTPRVWSKEARTRIAKAVGLPAVTAIDNLLDAYSSVYPNRVHPVEDDGERIQPERDWLEFREHNTWEGETWYMYVRLESESDRQLAERLCAEWGDNYGEWKLDTWQQHRVDSWCNIPAATCPATSRPSWTIRCANGSAACLTCSNTRCPTGSNNGTASRTRCTKCSFSKEWNHEQRTSQPLWQVDGREGHVEFDRTRRPTIRGSRPGTHAIGREDDIQNRGWPGIRIAGRGPTP